MKKRQALLAAVLAAKEYTTAEGDRYIRFSLDDYMSRISDHDKEPGTQRLYATLYELAQDLNEVGGYLYQGEDMDAEWHNGMPVLSAGAFNVHFYRNGEFVLAFTGDDYNDRMATRIVAGTDLIELPRPPIDTKDTDEDVPIAWWQTQTTHDIPYAESKEE